MHVALKNELIRHVLSWQRRTRCRQGSRGPHVKLSVAYIIDRVYYVCKTGCQWSTLEVEGASETPREIMSLHILSRNASVLLLPANLALQILFDWKLRRRDPHFRPYSEPMIHSFIRNAIVTFDGSPLTSSFANIYDFVKSFSNTQNSWATSATRSWDGVHATC